MTETRKKSLSVIYNGTEAWSELFPAMDRFTYTDSVDQSDTISFEISDRDQKWIKGWIPERGDIIEPCIKTENWNYEGERLMLLCGSFVVDDFSFSAAPLRGSINGVSAPVDSCFKETQNTKTWENATVQMIAGEFAAKYGLSLVFEADDIQVEKTEQSKQTDSDFLKQICEKYGLGYKVYAKRLVIWDYRRYFAQAPILTLSPDTVRSWKYHSTMQGTYTGVRVSYKNPKTKKMVDVLVGTEERLYKTNQKADNEAEAKLIGEGVLLQANRKASTMQITIPPYLSLTATRTVRISGFGQIDDVYFIESVKHSITRKAYDMQLQLSRISECSLKQG